MHRDGFEPVQCGLSRGRQRAAHLLLNVSSERICCRISALAAAASSSLHQCTGERGERGALRVGGWGRDLELPSFTPPPLLLLPEPVSSPTDAAATTRSCAFGSGSSPPCGCLPQVLKLGLQVVHRGPQALQLLCFRCGELRSHGGNITGGGPHTPILLQEWLTCALIRHREGGGRGGREGKKGGKAEEREGRRGENGSAQAEVGEGGLTTGSGSVGVGRVAALSSS